MRWRLDAHRGEMGQKNRSPRPSLVFKSLQSDSAPSMSDPGPLISRSYCAPLWGCRFPAAVLGDFIRGLVFV